MPTLRTEREIVADMREYARQAIAAAVPNAGVQLVAYRWWSSK